MVRASGQDIKIIILVLLLGLSGCAFVFQDFNEGENKNLVYGMSKEEVTRDFGVPQKESKVIITGKEYEVWEYPVNELSKIKSNRVGISSRKVFFLGDKVVLWDKDKVYAQPSFEFLESLAYEQEIPTAKISEPGQNLK